MKMISLIDGVFWGVVLIALGVWFLVRHYVPVHIPVIRILVAVLFVYVGVRVLAHGPGYQDRNTVVFSQSNLAWSPERGRDYNVIFSSGTVDLSGVTLGAESVRMEVNVIFGSAELRIDPALPVRVSMSSAFGSVEAPNERTVAFGDSVYTSPSYKSGAPALEIHATAVFGRLTVRQ
jgi:predicted membrane protein